MTAGPRRVFVAGATGFVGKALVPLRTYMEARAEAAAAIVAAGLAVTILRSWYVLGPGRRWPLALVPVYRALEALPATRETARRLGLVTLDAMVAALAAAVEDPPAAGARIVDVPAIRAAVGRECDGSSRTSPG